MDEQWFTMDERRGTKDEGRNDGTDWASNYRLWEGQYLPESKMQDAEYNLSKLAGRLYLRMVQRGISQDSRKNPAPWQSGWTAMKKRIKSDSLLTFLKDNCANFSHDPEGCLRGGCCDVIEGRQCKYFENKVLGPPDYKYRQVGYDYVKLFDQYAERTKSKKIKINQRQCPGFDDVECGRPLLYRRRLCDECRRRRARKANRERQKRFRLQNVLT